MYMPYHIEAIDRTIKDLMGSNIAFGDESMLFMEEF